MVFLTCVQGNVLSDLSLLFCTKIRKFYRIQALPRKVLDVLHIFTHGIATVHECRDCLCLNMFSCEMLYDGLERLGSVAVVVRGIFITFAAFIRKGLCEVRFSTHKLAAVRQRRGHLRLRGVLVSPVRVAGTKTALPLLLSRIILPHPRRCNTAATVGILGRDREFAERPGGERRLPNHTGVQYY